MNRIFLLLAIFLLSCGQPPQAVKTNKDNIPLIDEEAVLLADRKASLEELFLLNKDSADFRQQQLGASLLIGSLFDSSHKDAVFRYQENDSVESVFVLRQSAGQWDTIFSVRSGAATGGAFDEFIEISDFNGDHIPDLKVIKEHWYIHDGERADLWLYANNHFTRVEGFDSIISSIYDEKTDLIYAYQSAGCADMAMYFGVFKITGNKVKRIQEMRCNCCQEAGDSCSIEVEEKKPYRVSYEEAYKHVPVFYADAVKAKCGL